MLLPLARANTTATQMSSSMHMPMPETSARTTNCILWLQAEHVSKRRAKRSLRPEPYQTVPPNGLG
eukprot:5749336-Lingulodinium_polyedra.AAC.1